MTQSVSRQPQAAATAVRQRRLSQYVSLLQQQMVQTKRSAPASGEPGRRASRETYLSRQFT